MFLFIIYVILSTSGLILFKIGSQGLHLSLSKALFSANIPLMALLGLFCYLCSFLLWMYIISKTDVSFIVPLGVAVTNILILLSSVYILKENVTTQGIIGAVVIIIGVVIMSLK